MAFPIDTGGAGGVMAGYEVLARIIAERKKDELIRQKEIEDARQFDLQQQQLQEQTLYRQQQQEETKLYHRSLLEQRAAEAKALNENRALQEEDRQRTDLQRQYQETPATQVTADEYARAIATGGVSRGLFTPDPIVEGAPQTFQYRGGADWQQREAAAAARVTDREDRQAATAALAAAAGNRPNITIQPVWNPQTGTSDLTVLNKRALTPGQVIGPAPPSAGQQTQMLAAEGGLQQLSNIQRLYKPEYVGPVQGRLNEWVGLKTGYTRGEKGMERISPQLAEFANAVSTNKNRMIKLITGAAMNREEIPRILGQVPDFSQPPELFEANLNGGIQLEAQLIQRIRQRKAQRLATPGVDVDATGAIQFFDGGGAPAMTPRPDAVPSATDPLAEFEIVPPGN